MTTSSSRRRRNPTVPKRVLIAHQSTVPHYRVDFYRAVEDLRPDWWSFDVVWSRSESRRQRFLEADPAALPFPVRRTRTLSLRLGRRRLVLQTFPLICGRYDLVVVGDELRNLSYPLCYFRLLFGRPVARWGHGRLVPVPADPHATRPSSVPRGGALAAAKRMLWRRSAGFFAYTEAVRDRVVAHGVPAEQVFVLNNTIDILAERRRFEDRRARRGDLRRQLADGEAGLLLALGRPTADRRCRFLGEVLAELAARNGEVRLVLAGPDPESWRTQLGAIGRSGLVTCLGPLSAERLAEVLTAVDLHLAPGLVGLAPLQGLCYDLVPVVIDSPFQKPEYRYLTDENTVICPAGSTPREYAARIDELLADPQRLERLRENAWPSIRHLTIGSMACSFVDGIGSLLTRRMA